MEVTEVAEVTLSKSQENVIDNIIEIYDEFRKKDQEKDVSNSVEEILKIRLQHLKSKLIII